MPDAKLETRLHNLRTEVTGYWVETNPLDKVAFVDAVNALVTDGGRAKSLAPEMAEMVARFALYALVGIQLAEVRAKEQ